MCENAYIAGAKLQRRAGMAITNKIEIETVLNWATVRPGDKLLIAVKDNLNMQEAEDIRTHLEGLLPGVKVIALPARQMMVYRPDDR